MEHEYTYIKNLKPFAHWSFINFSVFVCVCVRVFGTAVILLLFEYAHSSHKHIQMHTKMKSTQRK